MDCKVRRRHHSSAMAKGWKESGLFNFAKGFFVTLARNYVEVILQCIGLNAAAVKFPAIDPDDNNLVEKEEAGDTATWKTILGYLGKAIDVVCIFKDKVQEYFGIVRRRWLRKQRKLFAQGKRMMRAKWWDWVETGWAAVKAKFSASYSAFQAKAASLAKDIVGGLDWAKAKADDVINWVGVKIKEVFAKIVKAFSAIKDRFVTYFKNNKFDALKSFLSCFNTIALSDDGLGKSYNPLKVFTDFWATLAGLGTPVGWAKLLVNLICNWSNLKDGIENIVKSYQEKVKAAKWQYAGVASAKFMISIAG